MRQHRFYLFGIPILIALFFVRLNIYQYFHHPFLDHYLNKTFSGKGIVIDEPTEKSFYTQVIVKLESVKGNQQVLLHAPFSPSFKYGDEVSIKGKLSYPKDFQTDAGHTFHYQEYLAKDNIFYVISSPNITLVSKNKGNPIKAFLFKIKESFISHIEKILPRPESSLMSGMLIAGKQGLGKDLEDKFKQVGLIHIVVLSGYNVTIVAEALISSLFFFPQTISYGFGVIGIILFGIMAGGSSTIVRASFMSFIALIAKLTGNTYSALRALIASGIVMIFLNPLILRYDPSFQLSFLATFGLIVFSPIIQKRLSTFGQSPLGEIISSTLAVELFIFPYLLYSNGSVALISFPANLLVLSYIPFTMLIGFIATISSYIYLPLCYPFSFISFIMLRYTLNIVEIATHFTFFSIHF